MRIADNYYTLSQVADELGVTRQTVSRWIKSKKMPAEKIGREILIEKRIVDEERVEHWSNLVRAIMSWHFDADNYRQIREYCHFSDEDKLEIHGNPEDKTFLATLKDGTKKKVEVINARIGYLTKERKIEVILNKEDVVCTDYEEPKIRARSKKRNKITGK